MFIFYYYYFFLLLPLLILSLLTSLQHWATMIAGLALALLLLLLPLRSNAANSSACQVAADASGVWWLECPGAGMPRTLSVGVNHVENCDRSLLPNNTHCLPGAWGPRRASPALPAGDTFWSEQTPRE